MSEGGDSRKSTHPYVQASGWFCVPAITNNLNNILNDEHLRHYQSLSKSEQEEAKQKMSECLLLI